MLNKLPAIIKNKRIAILGFGMEGQSTFRFLSKHFPEHIFLIADQNKEVRDHPRLQHSNHLISTGKSYLGALEKDDFVIKSPGIKLPADCKLDSSALFSQTDLFIQAFHKQIIGITGTKGKSTTSSLLLKILIDQNKKAILIGNIGKPAFDYWDKIEEDTLIVFELSAHQLEFVRYSPDYSILLNLFPEHLDYFKTKENYFRAKLNIAKFQTEHDFFFLGDPSNENSIKSSIQNIPYKSAYNLINNAICRNSTSEELIQTNEMLYLKGLHQLKNCIPLLDLVQVLKLDEVSTLQSIKNFKPLPHRIEFIGAINGLHFYNDSISTIPEASIEALKALVNVDYLILGGLDRKLNYQKLYDFLEHYPLKIVFFIGPAGKRMFEELTSNSKFNKVYIEKFQSFEIYLKELIEQNKDAICLLSPAAASYDEFKNFETRGNFFRTLIEKFL
ncbi:MAG: UDP-N-acetylmuramoyl-L-alanine--D-glutamate ligase [Bacteroidales bacterium]|nr:UDP-N-acetylmuramoyl-L-alanine--D-glutamate ligase [Bacteroidales bacterium]